MKKILLTSTGLENPNITKKFLELLAKKPEESKILFITTAAIEPDAVMILPKCMEDLLNISVPMENIVVYDMHKLISKKEIIKYDAIYVCGGNTDYLVSRIDEIGFKNVLDYFLKMGGIYLGVSAGSVCASGNYTSGLKLLPNKLDVHCDSGSNNGFVKNNEDEINLTDEQAIYINETKIEIFS